jgi:hypothetical protein
LNFNCTTLQTAYSSLAGVVLDLVSELGKKGGAEETQRRGLDTLLSQRTILDPSLF